jgi:hypothetical protein
MLDPEITAVLAQLSEVAASNTVGAIQTRVGMSLGGDRRAVDTGCGGLILQLAPSQPRLRQKPPAKQR